MLSHRHDCQCNVLADDVTLFELFCFVLPDPSGLVPFSGSLWASRLCLLLHWARISLNSAQGGLQVWYGGKKKPRLACTRAPDLNLIKVIFGMNCNANCKPDLIAQHQRLALLMLFVAEMEQKTLQPVSKNLVERHPSRAESVMAAD